MGAETESLVDALADLFQLVQMQCSTCQTTFYSSAKWDDAQEATVSRAVKCPKCGSKEIAVL